MSGKHYGQSIQEDLQISKKEVCDITLSGTTELNTYPQLLQVIFVLFSNDDYHIIRQGFVQLITADPDCRVIAEADDGVKALQYGVKGIFIRKKYLVRPHFGY